jgi:hypothetical protein
MKISLPTLILPIAGGFASAALVEMATWDLLRPAVLPAISIIAAAVLVRLARGLPFTNADHFTLDQFRRVYSNLEANARKLRALIFLCLIGVACLILGKNFTDLISKAAANWPIVGLISAKLMSGIIGAILTFSFTRVVEVVHSDVALLKLQSNVLEAVIAKKNADAFETAVASEKAPGIAGADRFGTTLPH